ncbi:MAG TPA: BatD family protein [Rhodanobacteraceae bacterium]|nr:BatD family protein [Rhodanobacteraceae bacterium]
MRRLWLAVAMLLMLLAPLARAAGVHAFVDRSQVSLGDTVTLNIQSDGALGNPDLTPLQQDFDVLGTSRSSSFAVVNGKATRTTQLGIALKPRRTGTLVIPALAVGGGHTTPLTVTVGAAPTGGTGHVGDPAFMESDVSQSAPWIGQQVVYTVRLYYLPDVQGSLADPTSSGARLIPLDRDQRYRTARNGYTYDVIERSWALIPDRAGAVAVHGPVFQGQRTGSLGQLFNAPNGLLNNPNALLNGMLSGVGAPVRAQAPQVRLDVRAVPANGGKPWLPARGVQLQLAGVPANGEAKAGVPLKLVLSVSASGQPAGALPEPALPPIAGLRVYPGQTHDRTDAGSEWLQGVRSRSFAVIPERDGEVTIPAVTLDWWSVAEARPEQATLPAHTLHVTGAIANASPPAASAPAMAATAGATAGRPTATPSVGARSATGAATRASTFWRRVALASLVLWVIALGGGVAWWALRRVRPAHAPATNPQGAGAAPSPAARPPDRPTMDDIGALQRAALDAATRGDPATCEHALLAWARATHPTLLNIAAVHDALGDAAQQAALDALQRARWQGAPADQACAAAARAFAKGFAWHRDAAPESDASGLPPLYPMR